MCVWYVQIYVYTGIYGMCICVCVSVCERERETESAVMCVPWCTYGGQKTTLSERQLFVVQCCMYKLPGP